MIKQSKLRAMIEHAPVKDKTQKPIYAATQVRNALGLCDESGNAYHDKYGRRELRKSEATIDPSEFSLRDLGEAFLGRETVEDMGRPGRVSMLEAGGGAVNPSAFANISGFTLAVGGLLEYKILERFQSPEYILAAMVENIPTKVLGGTKSIGVANIGDLAAKRQPSKPVKMVGLDERWLEHPETEEHSLGMELTFEAVSQDLTSDLLTVAGSIGDRIALRKEVRLVDLVLGIVNPYKYKGTAYNTYQTATPWINSMSNPLVDWNDINDVLVKFSKMTDAETGLPIMVNPTDMLVMPAKLLTARKVFRDTVSQIRTQTQAYVTVGENPVFGMFDPKTSPWLHRRATDADGLALSSDNADVRTIIGDLKRAFGYKEYHPLMVEQAIPSSHEMMSRRIVSAFFAYERGIPVVKEPRYVFVSTH